jgi:hypothetical protein
MSKENDFLLFYTPPHGYPDLLHEIGDFDMKHTVLANVVSFWVLGCLGRKATGTSPPETETGQQLHRPPDI